LVPPPLDRGAVLRTATEDWARDLERAQEQQMTNKSGDELSFGAFLMAIYELIDTLCESAEIAEYMDMIRRLIGGVIELDSMGAMVWRSDSDIVYDRHFSMIGDEVEEEAIQSEQVDEADEVEYTTGSQETNLQNVIIEEEKKTSILRPMTAKRRKKKEFVLPIEKINDLIEAIFQAKQKSDLWATKSDYGSYIRFDRFVLRYFMLQVGMLGVARRHLRLFVRSAVKHLKASQNGREELPRIYLFCCLTGLASPTPNAEYNPRLSAEYFQPALRSLFPNPMTIEAGFMVRKSKQDATYSAITLIELEKACVPLTLQKVVGGKVAIEHYRRDLSPYTTKGSCNLDLGLAFALSLWVFMDAMHEKRERAALRTLQRCFRQQKQARVAVQAEKAENKEIDAFTTSPGMTMKSVPESETFSQTGIVSEDEKGVSFPPTEAPKEESEPGPSLPLEASSEDTLTNPSPQLVDVTPSPRIAERLNEARNLDAHLNSQDAPEKAS